MRQGPLRELAIHFTCGYGDSGLVLAVYGVEVRRCVVAVVHCDHDTEEAVPSVRSSTYSSGGALIVGPHAEYAYDFFFWKDFIHQPIVDIDAPGIGARKVTYKFLE